MNWVQLAVTLIPQPLLVLAGVLVFVLYSAAFIRGRMIAGPYLIALAASFLPLAVFYGVALIGYEDQLHAVAASRVAFAVLYGSNLGIGIAVNRTHLGN